MLNIDEINSKEIQVFLQAVGHACSQSNLDRCLETLGGHRNLLHSSQRNEWTDNRWS